MAVISPDGQRIVGASAVESFPSLKLLAKVNAFERTAWLPGRQAFVTQSWMARNSHGQYPICLFERRRPEAFYGLFWLPQFCLLVLGVLATAWLIRRDVQRWRANPPALR